MIVRREPLWVACLCAAWCRTCDAYRDTLERVAGEFVTQGLTHPPRWIDIEDDEELVGDIDVQTFPTLLVANERQVLFAGPLTPQPETLRRLLSSLTADDAPMPTTAVPAAINALANRLRAR